MAEVIARHVGDDASAAATRVWSAAERLKKAGATANAPLVLSAVNEDGWSRRRSFGRMAIATFVVGVRGVAESGLALAVLAGGDHASL